MERTIEKKKSLGRQKIEIKKIEKKNNLQVTFSKRRKGLIKKAGELSVLCGADVAVLVQSPAGKIHAFGNIPVESIIDRYFHRNSNTLQDMNFRSNNDSRSQIQDQREKKCLEMMKKLEAEKDVEKALEESSKNSVAKGPWWDEAFDILDLNELEQYTDAMEALKKNVMNRADEKAKFNDVLIPNVTVDCFGGVPVPHTDFNTSASKPLMLFNPNPSS